jgi:multidrug efflux pump subunit AcrA (membrane-fusion protein)
MRLCPYQIKTNFYRELIMKSKLFLSIILALALVACGAGTKTSTAIPTVVLADNASTSAASATTAGNVTASGVVVIDRQVSLAFKLAGNITLVKVKAGDQVQAGQVLVQLDDSAQQIQLEQANLALHELSSPEAIANARLAVTKAQEDGINAQYAVNNQQYWKNAALVQDQYARLVIAKDNLDKAQEAYDSVNGGEYINNADEASLYQALYNAKKAYDDAQYYYSLYSQAPTQRVVDEAQAKLDLANAQLKNAQDYVAVLTGGSVDPAASGSALAAFRQAQLALQTAKNNLAATQLVAPFAGQVAEVNASVGDYVAPGQVLVVVSDVGHLHIETTDLSERDVPGVKIGQAVTGSVKALNQDVAGKVTVISPLADKLGGDVVYKVTISLDGLPAGLRPGMSVDVRFDTGQ